MCSNYHPASGDALGHFGVTPPNDDTLAAHAYPGSCAPLILRGSADQPSCVAGTFGLLPAWARHRDFARFTYNARTETVAEKPAFRRAWQQRQTCIVPATAIYEPNYDSGSAHWWHIHRTDGCPMALAGLWERRSWGDTGPHWSFTLLTINADDHPLMSRFHKPGEEKRRVVILPDTAILRWLDGAGDPDLRKLLGTDDGPQLSAGPGRFEAASSTASVNEKRGQQAALF
ncbi:MAG: DUF159 family protein [Porticoccaceae bacterium]|nr:DUF159 family protein [Porticoccaceae bacterium]